MRTFLCSLLVCVGISTAAYAADSATMLARILAAKHLITSEELAVVEAATDDQRVAVLTGILTHEGLLNGGDMAQLTPVAYAAPAPRTQAAQQTQSEHPTVTATPPPVISATHVPVTLYGTLVFNSFFDTALANIQDLPLFAAKQGSDALGNDKSFGMTARQTRFGLRFNGPEVWGGRLTGQLEMDFLGGKTGLGNGINMDIPRLRLALGRVDWDHVSLEGGQDWSIFAPLNPTSFAEYAIPEMSASGNPWIRMPQLRLEFHNAPADPVRMLFQVAAIDPNMGDYTPALTAARTPGIGERGRAPGIESRAALTAKVRGQDLSVGISEHWAHGKNAGTVGTTTIQLPMDSWGVALDYVLPFGKAFNLSGELYEGRALGIFSVASVEAILPVGSLGSSGVLSRGGWIQAQANWTPKWQTNLAYGIDDPKASDLPVGNRLQNQTAMANLMYKATAHVTLAWEWRRFITNFKAQRAAGERGDQFNMAMVYLF